MGAGRESMGAGVWPLELRGQGPPRGRVRQMVDMGVEIFWVLVEFALGNHATCNHATCNYHATISFFFYFLINKKRQLLQ